MAQNNQQTNKMKVVHVSALLEADRLPIGNVMLYDRVFNFSDFQSDDEVPNIRYLKAYVDANVGSGGSTGTTEKVKLPVLNQDNLIAEGADFYLDLSSYNLPDEVDLIVYVDKQDGLGKQQLKGNPYYDQTKQLYGFDGSNQLIYISYDNAVVGGGGTTPPGGTAQLVAVDKDNPRMFYNVLFDSTTQQFYPELNTTATAASDYAAVDKNSSNRYRVLYNSSTQTFYPELI